MKLIKIPIQQPFLKTAVDYFLKENESFLPDFSSLCCVFPSKRAAYYFKKRLLKEIDGVFIPPRLFSIVELYDWLLLSSGEERVFPGKSTLNLLLWNALKNYREELEDLNASKELWKDFLKFVTIGVKLGSFFQELEKEEINFDDLKKEALYSDYEKHIDVLQDVFVSYKKILKANGFLDDAERLKKVEEFVSTSPILHLSKLYFSGFLAITKKEKKIVNALSKLFTVDWISSWKENDFVYKNIEGLKFDETIELSYCPQILPEVEVFQCQNTMEEIAFVIKAIERTDKKGIPLNEIAVILPDESLAMPLISFSEKMGIPYNYSSGLPFRTSLSYVFVKSLCDVREADFYCAEFLSFLRHPFLKMMNEYAKKVEENIENEKKVRFDIFTEHIEGHEETEASLREIFSLCDTNKIETFCQKLKHILDKYSRESINIYERDTYHEILDEMDFLSKICNFSDFHSIVHLFLSLGNENRISLYGERENGIQLLGVLEARGIDFKAIIVPSLTEGVFPKKSEKEYFLNTYIRKRVGLPTANDREALFACYFDELSKAHPYVYFASRVDEKKGQEESRFLYPFQSKKIDAKILFYQAIVQKSVNTKKELTLPRKKDFREKLLNINYSATSINDFLFCPYKFYLKNVMSIPEPRKWKGEMEAVDYGVVVHDALKKIYQKGKSWSELKQLFEKELLSKAAIFYDEWRMKMYIKKFENFFNEEKKRFNEGWKIKKLEMRRKAEYRLKNDTLIKIKGTIDRIDERDGEYAILDYKTGYIKKTYIKKKNELVNVQLPFYALLLDKTGYTKAENIVQLGFYDLKKDFCLKAEKIDIKKFQDELDKIFALILDEDCPFYFTKQEEKCNMCFYKTICKKWLKW
ncbi:MAG: PD-(D/E)XK nuclease family protein [Campylobacterota bacterium]|nr:PD-(D/E)XK nuclease family protein [Campylobacterota bacterium]